MKLLGTLSVIPVLPKRLKRLNELAYNLWWSWNPAAQSLFDSIDPVLWEQTTHNPVKLLHRVAGERLEQLAKDKAFLAQTDAVMAAFDAYMHPASTRFSRTSSDRSTDVIASEDEEVNRAVSFIRENACRGLQVLDVLLRRAPSDFS